MLMVVRMMHDASHSFIRVTTTLKSSRRVPSAATGPVPYQMACTGRRLLPGRTVKFQRRRQRRRSGDG